LIAQPKIILLVGGTRLRLYAMSKSYFTSITSIVTAKLVV